MSVNRLMCSIHPTLYTGSIKQESARCAGAIVPLRAAKKASYKPPCKKKKKNSPQHHSSREQNRIREGRRNHMCNGEKMRGGRI